MRLPILALGLCLLALPACRTMYGTDPYGSGYPRAGDVIRGASLDKALIVQHTLYPYHFMLDGAGLNALGERDLQVLAAHFRQTPGSLQVRHGSEPAALYEARVKAVMAALVDAGVDGAQMRLKDGLPGGDGMPSDQVVMILAKQVPISTTSASGTDSSMQGAGISGGY